MNKHRGQLFLLFFSSIVAFRIVAQDASSIKYDYDQTVAITNVSLYINYNTHIDSATLVIHKGKIKAVGKKIVPPKGAMILNYAGKVIYPSFIETCSDYGIGAIASTPGSIPHYQSTTKGVYASNQAIKPEIEGIRYFKHDPSKAKLLREQGFGTVVTSNSDGIIRGTSTTVLLCDLPEEQSVIDDHTSLNMAFAKGSSTQEYPSSLMGTIALMRQSLYDADWYIKNIGSAPYNNSLEKLALYKQKPWIFDAGSALNMLRAQRIANEFASNVLIQTSSDDYQQLSEIKRLRPFLIVSLKFPAAFKISNPTDAELISNTQLMEWYFAPFNIQYLIKERIDFALSSSRLKDIKDFGKNLRKVFETTANEEEVLKSLTYSPSMKLGLYNKVGSLHPGKLANFIVCNTVLSAPDFTINENWVKGMKYDISRSLKHFSGVYRLIMEGSPEMKMEINTNAEKPQATLRLAHDTAKIPVNLEFKEDDVYLSFTLTKEDSTSMERIYLKSFYVSDSIIKGTVTNLSWNINRKFEAYRVDNSKELNSSSRNKIRVPIFSLPLTFSPFALDSVSTTNSFIIKNATLWTGEQVFDLNSHSLVVKDGTIVGLDKEPDVKKYFGKSKYQLIDAAHKFVTAGIIDEHSHIAINGGVNETGKSVTSEVRVKDVINPNDINIYRQLSGGVTTAHILHGSANCIGGQSALIQLKWGRPAEQLLFEGNKPFIKFALGENVKQSNWGDKYVIRYPQSRMGVEQTIMDAFERALYYQKQKTLASAKPPRIDLELEALQEILEQKRFITCHSYSQSEINMLMKLAEKYHFKVNTFTHVLEGYKIHDKLLRHGAGASSFSDWWSFKAEVRDAIPHNAAILSRAGVITAINSDDAEMGRRLNQEAAKSVKYGGLSQAEAWNLVTLNPAKLLKIDDKVGSLKVGKNADVVIWSGNPLSVYAKAEAVFIKGVKYFDTQENSRIYEHDKLLRDQLIKELLQDKTPDNSKVSPAPQKQEHYHCDSFETIE